MKSSLVSAINESISTTSSVAIEWYGSDDELFTTLREIAADADFNVENDGTLDCYGTVDGDSFRLAVTLVDLDGN